MQERPIIFNTEMVRAILDNRKTMTRRVIKAPLSNDVGEFLRQLWPCRRNKYEYMGDPKQGYEVSLKPYAFPGDKLWVRETWAASKLYNLCPPRDIPDKTDIFYSVGDAGDTKVTKWRPSIHMPKKFCRLWLEVKRIRIERLQDISEEDAKAEGIKAFKFSQGSIGYGTERLALGAMNTNAKNAFRFLWDCINGEPRKNGVDISWDANPWVWIIEFDLVKGSAEINNEKA